MSKESGNTSFTSTIFSKYAHSSTAYKNHISLLQLPQPRCVWVAIINASAWSHCVGILPADSRCSLYSCHCDTMRPSVIGPWRLPDYTLRSYRPFFPKWKINSSTQRKWNKWQMCWTFKIKQLQHVATPPEAQCHKHLVVWRHLGTEGSQLLRHQHQVPKGSNIWKQTKRVSWCFV